MDEKVVWLCIFSTFSSMMGFYYIVSLLLVEIESYTMLLTYFCSSLGLILTNTNHLYGWTFTPCFNNLIGVLLLTKTFVF
jgi:hypothetical protein